MLFGHSAVFYKDSIYVFGGGYGISSLKLSSSVSNQLYKINTNNNDSIRLGCSPGTISPYCIPCPAGTYFNNTECLPCPYGRYSTTIASTSIRFCLPCDAGYYSDVAGVTHCKECSPYAYCPIGSSTSEWSLEKESYYRIQPQAFSSEIDYISVLVSKLWYVTFAIYLISIALLLPSKSLWAKIEKLDIFVNQHSQALNKPVFYRKTKIGGLFTLFSILGVSVIIITAFLNFQLNNITEIKSLVPLIIIDTPISAAKLTLQVIFFNYGGVCNDTDLNCYSDNSIFDSGINNNKRTVNCQLQNSNCIINIAYNDISIESASKINIQMKELTSSASGISVLINCSSSIPSELSSIYIPIYTDSESEMFIGKNPTIMQFNFISSVIII